GFGVGLVASGQPLDEEGTGASPGGEIDPALIPWCPAVRDRETETVLGVHVLAALNPRNGDVPELDLAERRALDDPGFAFGLDRDALFVDRHDRSLEWRSLLRRDKVGARRRGHADCGDQDQRRDARPEYLHFPVMPAEIIQPGTAWSISR